MKNFARLWIMILLVPAFGTSVLAESWFENDYKRAQAQEKKAFSTFEQEFEAKSKPEPATPVNRAEDKPRVEASDYASVPVRPEAPVIKSIPQEQAIPERKPVDANGYAAVESQGFLFDFKGCKLDGGGSLICDFTITSLESDKKLDLNGKRTSWRAASRAFDEEGNEYSASSINLTNKSNGFKVTSLLVKGIKAKASVVFENYQSTHERLALLELNGVALGKVIKLQYRSIPIERKLRRSLTANP